MATTGELRTIIEELELEDVGDAVSYLDEEERDIEEEELSAVDNQSLLLLRGRVPLLYDAAHQLA